MKYNSVDLYATYNLIATVRTGYDSMPPIVNPNEDIVDYAIGFVSRIQPKIINIHAIIQQSSRANLITAQDAIATLLNPQKGSKALALDWPNQNREYTAKLQSMSPWKYLGEETAECDMTFFCADPCAYSTSLTTQNENLASDPESWNTTPSGSAVQRKLNIVLATIGAGTVVLANTTTGDTLTMTSDGTNITVDSEAFTCAGATAFSGHFPRLEPGVANAFTLTGAGTGGTATITFYDAYL